MVISGEGKWGDGMGRVYGDFSNVVLCVYVVQCTYIYDALLLKLSDGHTSPLVLFSIKFFVLIQHIFTEYLLTMCLIC